MNLKKIVFFLVCFLFSFFGFSQKMNIGGNVQDTISKTPLLSAVVIAVRLKDSVLVAHTRTDATGFFALKNMKIDTVQIIISHPKFGDQSFYVFASSTNYAFDFGKIILPSKSHALNEIVIYAYKDPVYYKGDTLMNGAFHSDLSEFILDRPQIRLWVHGHMHNVSDYMLGTTRVVCNPRGYTGHESRADQFELQYLEI